jgi:hypothetical protein
MRFLCHKHEKNGNNHGKRFNLAQQAYARSGIDHFYTCERYLGDSDDHRFPINLVKFNVYVMTSIPVSSRSYGPRWIAGSLRSIRDF